MPDKGRILTDKELAKMEKNLTRIYSRAVKEIGESWKEYMSEADKKLKPLQEAYEVAKKSGDVEEIKATGKALGQAKHQATLTDKRYKAVTEQLSTELSHVNETAVAYVNNKLPEIYSLNYNQIAKDMNDYVTGISFQLVDANTVKNLATTDKTLLPYKTVNGKKDVRWNTQMVNSEVMQGILQGESMQKIAKRLENVGMKAKGSAIRNARTTVTSAENKGRMDMLHDAADKGIISHKIWLAAHDKRTRDAHANLDGQERDVDDAFDSDFGKIMYPGDPEADPANVYNCRCTLIYKIVGFKKITNKK